MAAPSTSYLLPVELPDGEHVPVAVERKRVKNLNLRVRADGTVALSVPLHTSKARAQEFLNSRAAWIERQLKRARARRLEQQPISSPAGAKTGRAVIALWGERREAAQALGLAPEELATRSPAELQERVDALHRGEVARALPAVYGPLEARLGVAASRWQVRTMKTRWGSCTPKTGAIRINGALAAYPPCCLEAVVAHELVHLLEPSHNERFHALLDECCPGNRAAMARLKLPPIAPEP